MSNTSSDSWFAQVRRAWIEHQASRSGLMCRGMITDTFGTSMAQASADIQALLELHPGCLTYDLRLKVYRWTGEAPILPVPLPIASFDF